MALEKAIIINTFNNEKIPVMFNPSNYTLNKSNNFSTINIPGMASPHMQYTGGQARTLTMDLFFDSYEKKEDVRNYTSRVSSLLEIEIDKNEPPVLIFSWGSLNFRGVLTNVNEQFTLFLHDGTPVRAELKVNLTESWAEEPESSVKGADDKTWYVYRAMENTTLSNISQETLDDPARWREIANLNNIEYPDRIAVGMLLRIPHKDRI